MYVMEAISDSNPVEIEAILSASDTYLETLTIKLVEAQPWLIELAIKTQLLTAKNSDEKRVKARCCIERAQLVSLATAITQFLKSTSSSGEPQRR